MSAGRPILDLPIAGLGLSLRTTAALHQAGVEQLADLLRCSRRSLLALPHMTPACVAEVELLAVEITAWFRAGRP